jgi:hypothetical protein
MVWKKNFFVLGCCLTLTILSGLSNISAADKFSNRYPDNGHSGQFEGFEQRGLHATSTQSIMGSLLTDKSQLVSKLALLDDFFMMNSGLPYDQIKDTAVWGKYICFVNKGLTCLSADPQNPVKAIFPFDLLNGDLVDEDIADISASDDILYVATDKNIYKFVLAGAGKFTKSVEVEKGALQITAYKGGIVYLNSDNVLSGTTNIPAFDFGISDLFSTKDYLLIAGENGIYKWKPGLGSFEPVLDSQAILEIAPDYKNDALFAIKSDGGSKIMHCPLKPEVECSEFWSAPQEEITNVFLDGDKLYIVKGKDKDIYWADKGAKDPFFSYAASAEIGQDVANVINGFVYTVSQNSIQVFIDGGLGSQSNWLIKKPSMLSVKGGSFTKSWYDALYLVKEGALYRPINGVWQKMLGKVDDFAVTGNYGLIYKGGSGLFGNGAINLVDFADIIDGVTPDVHGSIEAPSFVTAMTADAEKVFIADFGRLYECPLPIDKDIDLEDCFDTKINTLVNDMTNIPALNEVLVCAENGLYRWAKGTDNLTQITTTPCKAATFFEDSLYMINNKGEISMLDAYGNAVKQLCKKLQPMKGGLEAKGNVFYISDEKRGVVVVDKKLFTEEACLSN